jgi:drug/metabolite transporter (DMT)-like permease
MNFLSNSPRFKARILLLGTVVVWAANYPLAKFGLSGMHPFIFNAIRYLTATGILWWMIAAKGGQVKIQRQDMPKIIGLGMLANVLYQIIFVVGLAMSTAGNTAVILSTSPLWTVLLHAKLHREKIPLGMWIGTMLSFLGVVLIIFGSGQKVGFGSQQFFGDCILLTAAALWGLTTNLQKPFLRSYSVTHITFIMMLVGGVGLTIIALPALGQTIHYGIGWWYLVAAILSGTFSIAIGNLVWSFGVKILGPSKTATFNNLVPVLALIFSYLSLHEGFVPMQFIGAAVTISGVWLAQR